MILHKNIMMMLILVYGIRMYFIDLINIYKKKTLIDEVDYILQNIIKNIIVI